MIVLLVLLVELVEHRRVGDQLLLVALQRADDLHHVLLDLVVAGLELDDVVAGLLEQAEEAALLALVHVKALELGDQVGQHVGDGAGVLGLHVLQNLVGELGDLHLRGVAVLEHGLAVGDVDALDKGEHRGLLLLGEVVEVQRVLLRGDRLHRLFLSLGRGLHGGGCGGRCGRSSRGFRRGSLLNRGLFRLFARQNQVGNHIVHDDLSFDCGPPENAGVHAKIKTGILPLMIHQFAGGVKLFFAPKV